MTDLKKRGSVAIAFAAALLAAPAISTAMPRDAGPASAADAGLITRIEPSAAALQRLEVVYTQQTQMIRLGPRFGDLWPEVTHVESIRRP